MIIYHIAETVILTLLIIRVGYYLKSNRVILRENLELILYITLVFIDNSVNLFLGNNSLSTIVFDSILPAIIILPIIFRRLKLGIHFLIFTILSLSTFSIILNNAIYNYILYLLSIVTFIYELIHLATGSSRNRKKIPLYLIFLVDLMAIVIVQQIEILNIKWDNSIFAIKSDYIALTIYMTNLILTHVYIRRYFTT
ncbi:MAG: hypothetical protein RIS91_261 [Bacteroidota bacterium]|jgi:hypothetical protein